MPTNSLICPKCGEENAPEAVMCWFCYAPFPGEGQEMHNARIVHERAVRLEKLRDDLLRFLPVAGSLFLIASGYVPQNRAPLIGMGLIAFAVHLLWSKRNHSARSKTKEEEVTPIESITNTILRYAVRYGASGVRLRAAVGIQVHFKIGEEWGEQMRVPGFIWTDLRALLLERTDNWQRPLVFDNEAGVFQFAPQFQRDFPLETVTLALQTDNTPRKAVL